jgi:sugar/nucleoside kinase (ribokinase family)
MKLLVIGNSVIDRIKIGENTEIKPGGIYYTSIGLLNFLTAEDEVCLITKMGKKNFSLFEEAYKSFDLSKLEWVDKMASVGLVIHEDQERWEHYDSVPESLTLPADLDYEIYDGILINMINGVDISIDNLSTIRNNFEGPIYFDVHTLSRGVGKDNHRYFRKIPNAEKWFSLINIVQANENEILTFCESDDERYIAEWTLNLGVSYLIVTKGSKGVACYSFDENNSVRKDFYKAESVNPVNKVGCGDIFGATLFYNFLASGDIRESIKLANRAAGLATTFTDTAQFYSLKDKMGIRDD